MQVRQLIAAAEVLANSHLLEKLSPLLIKCYARLRTNYGNNLSIKIDTDKDALVLTFTEQVSPGKQVVLATATISCTKNKAKLKVEGNSTKHKSLRKTCEASRDVTYAIDTWLDF